MSDDDRPKKAGAPRKSDNFLRDMDILETFERLTKKGIKGKLAIRKTIDLVSERHPGQSISATTVKTVRSRWQSQEWNGGVFHVERQGNTHILTFSKRNQLLKRGRPKATRIGITYGRKKT